MKIHLSRPDITEKEIKAVLGVLKTPNLSLGPKIPEFEEKFAQYIGTKYAVVVNSGTSALHLCIKALGIRKGDEVITTPFSFVASANCILFENANPVFVDIDPLTLNIDVNEIRKKITNRTKAILPVHIFGYPCRMDKVMKLAKENNLRVIEDACEAIGAEFNSRKLGTFGDCAAFAFYPNKQITTGEGGMIVTDSARLANLFRSMRNQGRNPESRWLEHQRLGFNYRLSDINCALGIAQLSRIKEILRKRSAVARVYRMKLKGYKSIELPPEDNQSFKRSWFVYCIRLSKDFDRDDVIKQLKAKGIECSAYFPTIHLQPFYKKEFGYKRGDFPVAESISARTIALPFYNNLKEGQIDYISKSLLKILKIYLI
ncbi:MAG: DegT/DnrJ/EryC1/StrS family aminotransferase [Candidatus Omnitrophica bacterium]|nr:DegT/DnrJ/EryC1/StrS family aminotransferase [Candidatus Omnitrophota bacterium]